MAEEVEENDAITEAARRLIEENPNVERAEEFSNFINPKLEALTNYTPSPTNS